MFLGLVSVPPKEPTSIPVVEELMVAIAELTVTEPLPPAIIIVDQLQGEDCVSKHPISTIESSITSGFSLL